MANPISKLNLVINGVTTQLDVHDANALTTEIDSMGTDWVRFKSGLQICWGAYSTSGGNIKITYPKAFHADYPIGIGVSGQSLNLSTSGWDNTSVDVAGTDGGPHGNNVTYVAVGRWK